MARCRFRFAGLLLFFVSACGGPPAVDKSPDALAGRVSGVAVKGLLASATVTARWGEGWTEAAGTARTDATGSFELEVGSAHGALLLEVTGGTYVEEATGDTVALGGRTLRAWVPGLERGEARTGVNVNPVTTLLVGYTRWRMETLGESFTVAEGNAARLLDDHFGQVDWRRTVPLDPAAAGAVDLSDEVRAGLVLGALSQLAQTLVEDEEADGRTADAATLVELLDEDLSSDGKLNGLGRNRRALDLCGIPLDGDTARRGLAAAMADFLDGERNGTGLTRADVREVLLLIASNESELFDSPAGRPDLDPPEIRFETPTHGDAVSGLTRVKVGAIDVVSPIRAFGFLEPDDLVQVPAGGIGSLQATMERLLDTTDLADGPLTLRVYAEDEAGYRAEQAIEVLVSNNGPGVEVLEPLPGAAVSGRVRLVAVATPNPRTHAALEALEVEAPAGLTDTNLAPERFEGTWDTVEAPEGTFTLRLAARDAAGSVTVHEAEVVVDNRERPEIAGLVQVCGRPVPHADVAVQGLVQGAWIELGRGRSDPGGRFVVALTDENHAGPLRVVAAGHADGATTWDDPLTDGVRSLGPSQALTTFLPEPTVDEVGVGLWTTVADALARHYVEGGLTPAEAWAKAEEMIAGHFQRPGWPGLHTARTYDLTEGVTREIPDVVLSLGELGLAWLVKDLTAEGGGSVGAVSAAQTLARDVSDGVFNGKEGLAPLTFGGGQGLDGSTTRGRLANAIHQLARSELNGSGITAQDLVTSGYLDMLTTDAREIYAYAGGTPFDQLPPEVTWTSPSEGENVGGAVVVVSATASDATGVSRMQILSPAGLVDLDGAPERLHVEVDDTVAPSSDGVVTVRVEVEDLNGNLATAARSFMRPAPTASIDRVLLPGGAQAPQHLRGPFQVQASATSGFASRSFVVTAPVTGVGGDADSSPLGIDVTIDPEAGALPDGPLEIVVVHETIDGRSATARRTVVLDNTPPVLVQAQLGGRVVDGVHQVGHDGSADTTGRVVFSYQVTDPIAGVDRCELSGMGQPASGPALNLAPVVVDHQGGCRSAPCDGAPGLTLQAGHYHLQLECWDGAGNGPVTTGLVPVVVDPFAPSLTDVSGAFENEDQLDFVWTGTDYAYPQRAGHVPFAVSEALAGPAAWKKMAHRLGGTTAADAAANNLPVIGLTAFDPGLPATPGAELVVEYLYEWSDGGAWTTPAGAGWRPVPVSASTGATHALLLSTDTLAPELADGGTHRVRVRAVDRAGNVVETVYEFTMEVLPPPVAIEVVEDYAAEADPDSIYGYTFAGGNMDRVFVSSTFPSGYIRLAKAILRQPHATPVEVAVSGVGPNGDRVHLERSRPFQVIQHARNRYNCVPDCTYIATPQPDSDDPPCVDAWDQPDRRNWFKIYYPDGTSSCTTDASMRVTGSTTPPPSPEQFDISVHVLDASGVSIGAGSTGTYLLAQGTYTVFVSIGSLDRTFISDRLQLTGSEVFGVRLQERLVFDGDELTEVGRLNCLPGGSCLCARDPAYGTCRSHYWNHESAVEFEDLVWFRGSRVGAAGHEVHVDMKTVRNGVFRDPFTGGTAALEAAERYPLDWRQEEQGL